MKDDVLARMAVEVDGNNPMTNVSALVKVTKELCQSLKKTPEEGALMLMTAAAFILDTVGVEKAVEKGIEPDYEPIIKAYMSTAAAAWNVNGMMFRGISKDELLEAGVELPDEEEDERKGVTLQ